MRPNISHTYYTNSELPQGPQEIARAILSNDLDQVLVTYVSALLQWRKRDRVLPLYLKMTNHFIAVQTDDRQAASRQTIMHGNPYLHTDNGKKDHILDIGSLWGILNSYCGRKGRVFAKGGIGFMGDGDHPRSAIS